MTNRPRQYTLPLPHITAMGAEDFMVAESNKLAVDWLHQWPNWAGHFSCLTGPSGSGKTHLLHVWQARSEARLVTPAELETMRANEIASDTKILALDDADGVSGNTIAEENLFHLYNLIAEQKGYLLLAARTAPTLWDVKLPDLKSRLATFHVVPILFPDDNLLAALLIKQFKDRQVNVSDGVIDYILRRVGRSGEAVQMIVNQLNAISLQDKRPITLPMAKEVLKSA